MVEEVGYSSAATEEPPTNSTSRAPIDDDDDDGGDAAEIVADDDTTALVAQPHPLEHSWTFWFDNPSAKSKQAAWGSSIRPVYTFSSVEEFWRYTHTC